MTPAALASKRCAPSAPAGSWQPHQHMTPNPWASSPRSTLKCWPKLALPPFRIIHRYYQLAHLGHILRRGQRDPIRNLALD
eukprot:5207918-Alexandrium_andersonii.AAC.1